jgi:hypothetical protein
MKGSGGQCAGNNNNSQKIEGGLCPPNGSFVPVFGVVFHGFLSGF